MKHENLVFVKQVDKGQITTMKDLESSHFKHNLAPCQGELIRG